MFRNVALKLLLNAWIPVLLLMGLIYLLSAQPKYAPPAPTTDVYYSGFIPVFPGMWELIIKKGEHMLIFGLLALLNIRALVLLKTPLKAAHYGAVLLTLAYAFSDELHQQFIFGRTASLRDVGFDLLGAVLAVFVVWQARDLWQRQRRLSERSRLPLV